MKCRLQPEVQGSTNCAAAPRYRSTQMFMSDLVCRYRNAKDQHDPADGPARPLRPVSQEQALNSNNKPPKQEQVDANAERVDQIETEAVEPCAEKRGEQAQQSGNIVRWLGEKNETEEQTDHEQGDGDSIHAPAGGDGLVRHGAFSRGKWPSSALFG